MVQDSWYALSVKSRWESVVAANLRSKGYEPFVPTYRVSRRWSDRVKPLEMHLFSGYLFCRLDLRARLPILALRPLLLYRFPVSRAGAR